MAGIVEQKRIQVFGLRRSGTSWITTLVRINFHVADDWGDQNKHELYDPARAHSDGTIVVGKDVYAWLRSYCDWKRVGVGEDFFAFIRDQRLVDMYCRKLRSWLAIPERVPVRYEDVLRDYKTQLIRLKCLLGLRPKTDKLIPLDDEMGPRNYRRSGKRGAFDMTRLQGDRGIYVTGKFARKDYYLNKDYMGCYTPEMIAWIAEHLDVVALEFCREVNRCSDQAKRI